jgi:hypothetical protein
MLGQLAAGLGVAAVVILILSVGVCLMLRCGMMLGPDAAPRVAPVAKSKPVEQAKPPAALLAPGAPATRPAPRLTPPGDDDLMR